MPVGALEASPGKIKEGLRLISMQSSIYLRDSYLASGTRKDAIDNDLSVPSSLDVAFIVWALLHPYSRHHLPHTSTLPPRDSVRLAGFTCALHKWLPSLC